MLSKFFSKRKKACFVSSRLFYLIINPATSYFPTPERCSIIGSSRLNFRVRDGNGCDPTDRITGNLVGGWRLAVSSRSTAANDPARFSNDLDI